MKRSTKIWLAAAAMLTVGGIALFAVSVAVGGLQFGTEEHITSTYHITDRFDSIDVSTATADISFVLSGDGKCTVECDERENMKHSVTVKGGTLVINAPNEGKWWEHIVFDLRPVKITVFLPDGEYGSLTVTNSTGTVKATDGIRFDNADIAVTTGDVEFYADVTGTLKISTTTGDVRMQNATVGTLDLTVTTGKTALSDITCKTLTSSGSTGSITLNNVTADGILHIERTTGSVRLDASDAGKIFVKTTTGDVTGRLLSDKAFVTSTSTGKVSVPMTADGGRCEIVTTTGDIVFTK